MNMKNDRDRAIGILLSISSAMLLFIMYLSYQDLLAQGMNRDLERENISLYRVNQGLEEKLQAKRKLET